MNAVLSLLLTVVCLFFLDGVAGHGYVQEVTIGGKVYPGWDPNIDPRVAWLRIVNVRIEAYTLVHSYAVPKPKRVIRKIPNDGPGETARAHICRTG